MSIRIKFYKKLYKLLKVNFGKEIKNEKYELFKEYF